MLAKLTPELSSLLSDFARYFELAVATTEQQQRAVYRLRYNVYCETYGYEDAEAFEDGLETDEFDRQSVLCLVTHRPTGRPAGCVRLVTVDADTDMPLERHCGSMLDHKIRRQTLNRRSRVAEISRLAVDSPFCRPCIQGEESCDGAESLNFPDHEQRMFPLIAVTLFLAAGAVADLMRRTDCFALMEPSLKVMLKRTGIATQRVGQDIEHKGTRAPYYLDIDESVRALPNELRLYYETVREQLSDSLRPAGNRGVIGTDETAAEHCLLPMGLNLGIA